MSSKRLTCSAILCALIIMVILPGITQAGESPVKMWEQSLTLPTYGIGEPERNPVFYNGKVYQGARGVQYPYPLQDKLTDIRADQTYTAVYLETNTSKSACSQRSAAGYSQLWIKPTIMIFSTVRA